jgi:tetratricopeptide (TPR) repeat protein
MPRKLICCATLPPATISSIPINDFAIANEELSKIDMEIYFSCCGKSMCGGCAHSFYMSGNMKCPFCNSERAGKTDGELVEEMMKRVEANDAGAMEMLGNHYEQGLQSFQQDHTKAMELYARAADLGYNKAHFQLGVIYDEGGDVKKAKFHFEVAAMAGHEEARNNIGLLELKQFNNTDRAVKHWIISASAGSYNAMHNLKLALKDRYVSRESIDSTLTAYNNSCAEMRSEARDAWIRSELEDDK